MVRHASADWDADRSPCSMETKADDPCDLLTHAIGSDEHIHGRPARIAFIKLATQQNSDPVKPGPLGKSGVRLKSDRPRCSGPSQLSFFAANGFNDQVVIALHVLRRSMSA